MAEVVLCTRGLADPLWDPRLLHGVAHVEEFDGTLADYRALSDVTASMPKCLVFSLVPSGIRQHDATLDAIRDVLAMQWPPALVGLLDSRFAGTLARQILLDAALDAGCDVALPTWQSRSTVRSQIRRLVESKSKRDAMTADCDAVEPWSLHVDPSRRELVGDSGRSSLTGKEALLMQTLLSRQGIVSRAEMGGIIWREGWEGTPKAIDMHVSNLRRKLRVVTADHWKIRTVRGSGFILELDPGDEVPA